MDKIIKNIHIRNIEQWVTTNWSDVTTLIVDTVIPEYNGGFYRKVGFIPAGDAICSFGDMPVRALRLENHSSYIKVIDVKKLPHESTGGYDAVIILNKCMAGRPDPRMESFIDDTTEKEKLVVLTTGRLGSWKPESPRVDAMSSASVMTQAAPIGKLLAEKALKIVKSQ
jgi:hypothetical protein